MFSDTLTIFFTNFPQFLCSSLCSHCARAEGDRGEARRGIQHLLRGSEHHVQLPAVRVQWGATHGRHRVHHEQRAVPAAEEPLERVPPVASFTICVEITPSGHSEQPSLPAVSPLLLTRCASVPPDKIWVAKEKLQSLVAVQITTSFEKNV